jgi:hypothetical protein
MSILHYTEATGGLPNSGRLSGTDGDLVGILDVALVANSWAIEYTATNARIYRPGSGNRFRLYVNDQASISGDARLSVWRGCENASAASNAGLTDAFPTAAKIADGSANLLKSNTANTTARNFDIFVAQTWVAIFVNFGGSTDVWEFNFFGDCPPAIAGDSYNTLCVMRGSTSTTTVVNTMVGKADGTGNVNYNWARSYDGTVKSTSGGVLVPNGSIFGNQVGPQAQAGPTTGIDRAKMVSTDTGTTTTSTSTSLGLIQRAWLPNMWLPLHSGLGATAHSRDTFTDTSYNAGATFTLFARAAGANGGFMIVETSDTWALPGV